MLGGQAGVLWNDRWETAVRATWFDRPQTSGASAYYIGSRDAPHVLRVVHMPGNRVLLTGQVLYHYWHGSAVRPFLGVGIGTIRDREVVRCEVAGCDTLLPGLPLGELTSSTFAFAGIAGVSATFGEHFVIRGGVEIYCPVCEEVSVFETYVGLGYRFGRR